jgi:hypothetical protein
MSTQFTNRQWRLPNNENKDKQSNYSMDFDGSGYISVTPIVLTDFSVSFWINPSTSFAANYDGILGQGTTATQGGILRYLVYNSNASSGTVLLNLGGSWSTVAYLTNGVWSNVILTYDSTADELKSYKNGSLDTTISSPDFSGQTTNAHSFVDIGRRNASSGTIFNGKLDGISLFDYALTDGTGGTVNQIAALYGSSSTGIGNPMSLSPKPVAYYPLGDQDAFNGANYLVPNSSLKDYVFDFDSTSPGDYISIASAGGIALMNTGVSSTVSLWVYPTGTGTRVLFEQQTNLGRYVIYQSGTSLFFYPNSARASFTNLILNQWYNVVTIVDGSNSKFYVNGNEVGTSTSYTPINTLGVLEFGRYPGGTQYFQGKLSNVQIFNTDLSEPEVETLYNNGSPIRTLANIPQNSNLQGWYKLDASDTYDSSTGNWTIEDHAGSNDGTSSGMSQANLVQSDLSFTSGYSPYALDFDSASSDYISLPTITLTDNWSVSVWMNQTTPKLRAQAVGTSTGSGFFAYGGQILSGGGNIGKLAYYNGVTYITLSNNRLDDGNWHHWVITYNHSTTTLKCYIDGQENYSDTYNTGTGNTINRISNSFASNYWLGQLSNISIWNTDLTQAQVTEIYNEGVPSNLNNHSAYSNLVSWWQLGSNSSFNTNWTVLDEKGSNNGTSANMGEDAIVDGVGSYANGLSSGMGGDEVIGDAPYSSSNALSVNMDVEDRVTDTPS